MSKRMIFYVAGIVPESKSSYSVYVPDFPEITSGGQSVQEAFFNANQALHDTIAERVKQKHSLPPAATIDEVKAAVLRIRQENDLTLPENSLFCYLAAPISLLYGLGPVHDSTSKRIFSTKEAFLDLVRCFVPAELLQDVNFETLEKQPETFISSQYGELRDDVVWRLKTKGDQWCFLYIITEFQSSVVRHMAARIDEYVGVLRMDLIRSGVINTGDPYPLILPIVLYRCVPINRDARNCK